MAETVSILAALWYILPAYIANLAPPIGAKILGDYNAPIHKEILGDGKTIGGLAFAILFGTLTGVLQSQFSIPGFVGMTMKLAFLLSLGAMVGDMLGSFIKRQLGIKRGGMFPVLDQEGFVLFAMLFGLGAFTPPVAMAILVFVKTPILHIAFNMLGYALKLKREWW